MAQQLSEVMEMSLDDYIASKSIANATRASKNGESTFKAERRKQASDEEEEEDVEESKTIGIWKVPADSSTKSDDFQKVEVAQNTQQKKQWNNAGRQMYNNQAVSRYDLRDRICGNGSSEIPHVYSQQWRLRHPNIDSARPAGMPPAVPINAPMINPQMQWCNRNYRRYRNRGNWNGNRNWGNNRNDGMNGVGFNGGGYNNRRIQHNNTRPNNNVKIIAGGIKCLNDNMFPPGGKSVNSTGSQLQLPGTANSGDRLKALMGINDSDLQMIPIHVMASKFFDYFQNRSQEAVHKPIYDIQVHKEIHEIQGKPLAYKCPGGEVVSSDGAGIDCTIVPSSSGVSLNYRFA